MLDRARSICLALPEATADDRHPPHRGFLVGKKNFAWFVVDEHGDGRIGLGVRAAAGENEELVATDPERFGLPKYVARHGWVTYYLDLPGRPWTGTRLLSSFRRATSSRPRLGSRVSWTTENRRSGRRRRSVAGRFRCPLRRGWAAQAGSTGLWRSEGRLLASAPPDIPELAAWPWVISLQGRRALVRPPARMAG